MARVIVNFGFDSHSATKLLFIATVAQAYQPINEPSKVPFGTREQRGIQKEVFDFRTFGYSIGWVDKVGRHVLG